MGRNLHVDLGENSYNIIIEKGIIDSLGAKVKDVYKGKKIFVITDENVNKHYGDRVMSSLEKEDFIAKKLVLKAGEETKSFNTLPEIYNELLDFKLTRKDLIITLGGGVIGDLGGFAAASYLRGVAFIQVPTSLLAQVDSSVGGKVAVDLDRGKNLIGSFYQPKAVFIDPNVLETLPEKFYKDGMGEVIKYGCIKDYDLFCKLESIKSREELMNNVEDVVYTCCFIKKTVVENDEKDLGERMVLNFGHTLGHAIETYYNYKKYSHGEAVSIGMYNIALKGESINITEKGTAERIKNILINYGLPYKMLGEDNESIVNTIKLDKKNLGSKLEVILLENLGKSIIYDTTPDFFKVVK